jgi:xylulokinase
VQEGVAFAMRYGLDIMRENGLQPTVVRAGKANLFLSKVFSQAFASVNNISIEYYDGDGSYGAAIGAGIGAGVFANTSTAFANRRSTEIVEPKYISEYNNLYPQWKEQLEKHL